MKMQRSTAQRLVDEMSAALQGSGGDEVVMPKIFDDFIADILARADLQKAIDESANQ